MTTKSKLPFLTIVLLIMLVAFTAIIVSKVISGSKRPANLLANVPAELQGIMWPSFKPIQPFQLVDQRGDLFDTTRLSGKWSLIFFGYTSCPDICPTTMSVLNSVYKLIDNDATKDFNDTQVILISVDPKRDTSKKLADYVAYFNKDFLGVTAKQSEIDAFTKQFAAGYLIEAETAPGEYIVNHTSAIFLVDPSARLVAMFSLPHYADTIAEQFRKIRDYLL